jgi:hypothetical protein
LSPDNHFICDCPYRDEGIFRSNLDVKTLWGFVRFASLRQFRKYRVGTK